MDKNGKPLKKSKPRDAGAVQKDAGQANEGSSAAKKTSGAGERKPAGQGGGKGR